MTSSLGIVASGCLKLWQHEETKIQIFGANRRLCFDVQPQNKNLEMKRWKKYVHIRTKAGLTEWKDKTRLRVNWPNNIRKPLGALRHCAGCEKSRAAVRWVNVKGQPEQLLHISLQMLFTEVWTSASFHLMPLARYSTVRWTLLEQRRQSC